MWSENTKTERLNQLYGVMLLESLQSLKQSASFWFSTISLSAFLSSNYNFPCDSAWRKKRVKNITNNQATFEYIGRWIQLDTNKAPK